MNDLMPMLTLMINGASALASTIIALMIFLQMKIANDMFKLDIYNKRFRVYETAIDLYLVHLKPSSAEEISLCSIEFMKAFGESRLLFNEKDGVYATLEKVKEANNLLFDAHNKNHCFPEEEKAYVLHEIEKYLIFLEKQIDKYIYLKTVGGWKWKAKPIKQVSSNA